MVSHGVGDDLEIQIDVNLENSSFELNNIENIGISTSSSTQDTHAMIFYFQIESI